MGAAPLSWLTALADAARIYRALAAWQSSSLRCADIR